VAEWLVLLVLLALAALYHKRRTAAIKRHYEEVLRYRGRNMRIRELLAHVEARAAERAQRIFDERRAKELEGSVRQVASREDRSH
jgi:hypothetical protein